MEEQEYSGYRMEELLPVVAVLAEKYTSGESSSVTYETAQTLMEAVIYTVSQFGRENCSLPAADREVSAGEAYRGGYESILQKVAETKDLYDRLTVDFEDYGCRNYRDTILGGMPAFFLEYDARFQPQNHILTLDYPAMAQCRDLCGIDLIHAYLNNILIEREILTHFDCGKIKELIRNVEDCFGISYMGNICELVLLQVIGCMAAGRQTFCAGLGAADLQAVSAYFGGDSRERLEEKIQNILRRIAGKTGMSQIQSYFEAPGHEFAVRILNGIQCDALSGVFAVVCSAF